MPNNVKSVLIVGTSDIAAEYCKILLCMGITPDVVGRNEEKAAIFGGKNGVKAYGGGIEAYMASTETKYDYAIVATDIMSLSKNTCTLIHNGIKQIFTEKPAGMNKSEIENICRLSDEYNASVYVAYNRRFFSSTDKAIEIIKEDGGVKSFNFEFTEWTHIIEPLPTPAPIKEAWFLANSTHVVDLAFFLGGEPKDMHSFVSGNLTWHKDGCVYAGAGVSENNALFSYQANWAAPGRWAVEVLTSKHRLYFKPMEKLAIQNIGSVAVNQVEIDDKLDQDYKPGFYKEVESFILNIDDGKKKTIQDQLRYMLYFEQIEGKHK